MIIIIHAKSSIQRTYTIYLATIDIYNISYSYCVLLLLMGPEDIYKTSFSTEYAYLELEIKSY